VLQREGLLCREGVVVVVRKRRRESERERERERERGRDFLLKILEMGQKNL
jgi:hypothetical protein